MGLEMCSVYVGMAVFLHLSDFTLAEQKRWVPNTNVDNPSNWNLNRAPCSKDRILIPESSATIYIQNSLDISEVILPINGEIAFGENAILSINSPESPTDNCIGEDISFVRNGPKQWLHPNNWCMTSQKDRTCSPLPNVLSLHAQRIPCAYDDVIFPTGSLVQVDLGTGDELRVGKLSIGGKQFSTDSFKEFLETPLGRTQFVHHNQTRQPSLIVQNAECSNASGCLCNNLDSSMLATICSFVSCSHAPCDSPFKPIGHCCGICGADLELGHNEKFHITNMRKLIDEHISKTAGLQQSTEGMKNATVQASLDLIPGGKVQVVLTDDADGAAAINVATRLKETLQSDVDQGGQGQGVTSLHFVASKETPSSGGRNLTSLIVGILVAILIIGLIVTLLVFLLTDRCHPSTWRLWTYVRFGRPEDDSAKLPYDDITGTGTKGFENPTYGVQVAVPGRSDMQPSQATIGTISEVGFSNPMYGKNLVQEIFHDPVCTTLTTNPAFDADGDFT